jgi:hypothetical protein
VPQPSTFWSKKALSKVGLFDESLHYTMDYDYWLRLAEHYKPVVCSDRLSQFRLHSESKSVSSRDKMFAEELTVMAKHHPTTQQKYIHYLHSFITSNIYTMID